MKRKLLGLYLLISSFLIPSLSIGQISVLWTYTVAQDSVHFNINLSGNPMVSYQWSYGYYASDSSFNYVKYPKPGSYYACLTVYDSLSNSSTYCDTIVVPCFTEFSYSAVMLKAQFSPQSYMSGNPNSRLNIWNYGDGHVDSIRGYSNPYHIYSQAGSYNVCLTSIDTLGGCSDSYCDSVSVDSAKHPFAAFSYSVNGQNATFTPLYNGSNITGRSWYTPNANSQGNNVFKYSRPGTFVACQTVTDSGSNTYTYCDSVTLQCFSDFSYTRTGMTAYFTNKMFLSYPGSYYWNFGDSAVNHSYHSPYHTYGTPGTYNACLYVFDTTRNCNDVYCDSITVDTANTLQASFNYTLSGDTVAFNPSYSGGSAYYLSWNYGGPATLVDSNRILYNAPGKYNVCLTVTDSMNNNQRIFCDTVIVPCHAKFSHSSVNYLAFFTNESYAQLNNYLWDFGDNTTSTQVNPNHLYTATGNYNVCLTVNDTLNCSSTYCDSITIDTIANNLTLSYTYTVNKGKVYFSTITNGNGMNYSWTYGGNPTSTGYGYARYSLPGTYLVCVTGTDTNMNTINYCDTVVIPCQADFNVSRTLLNVSFNNRSFNSGNDYSWNFGDGNTSTQSHPSHTYTSAGTYNVCLTVVDSLTSCTSTYCDSITVISSYQCSASFSYSIVAPGKVLFTDNSTSNFAGTFTSWSNGWQSNGNGQQFTHQFHIDSTYQLCMTHGDTLGGANCQDTYCDSITITGAPPRKYGLRTVVYKDSNYLDSFRIYVIKVDSINGNPYLYAVDSVDNSSHTFSLIEGTYFLKAAALPNSQRYSSLLPTYFDEELLWSNATPIYLNQYKVRGINMKVGSNTGGPGFISGYVSQGANLLPGDPIPGLNIILTDGQENPVTHTITDKDGKYEFKNLALGTYKIYCDLLNRPANPIIITLDQDNQSSTENEIVVNSDGTGPSTGLLDRKSEELDIIEIYPNPSKGLINIRLISAVEESIDISLMSITGRSLISNSFDLKPGAQVFEMDLSKLSTGVYFIRLSNESEIHTERLILH